MLKVDGHNVKCYLILFNEDWSSEKIFWLILYY